MVRSVTALMPLEVGLSPQASHSPPAAACMGALLLGGQQEVIQPGVSKWRTHPITDRMLGQLPRLACKACLSVSWAALCRSSASSSCCMLISLQLGRAAAATLTSEPRFLFYEPCLALPCATGYGLWL